MNELKPDDVMRALECCANRSCEGCPLERPNEDCVSGLPKAALALLREKDAEIGKLKYTIIAVKQQMIGDLEAIWCEGHGFIEYDDLKRWKEQYLKDDQV